MARGGLVGIALMAPGAAWATDYTVGTSTGCATIQLCINTAVGAGDNIYIPPGTYTEALTLTNKTVNVRRLGSTGEVVLKAPTTSTMATITNGTVAFYDVTFDGDAFRRGIYSVNGALRLERVVMREASASSGAGVYQQGGSLTVVDSTFQSNASTGSSHGGGIYAYLCALAVTNSTFDANTAAGAWGGAVFGYSTTSFVVSGGTFTNNTANNGGGVAFYYVTSATVTGGTYRGNAATNVGGAIVESNGSLSITGSGFYGNRAAVGGAGVFVEYAPTFSLTGAWLEANAALRGSGVYIRDTTSSTMLRNTFCLNTIAPTSNGDGAGVYHRNTTGTVANNVFLGNAGDDYGGGLAFVDGGTIAVRNNDFIANSAGGRGSGAHVDGYGIVNLTNNLFAYQTAQPALQRTAATANLSYSAYWSNAAGDSSGTFVQSGPAAITTDPMFANYTPGVCTTANLFRKLGSPLLNAGTGFDVDGSVADIGAFGGPDADKANWADADADGAVRMWDCDDTDPNRSYKKTEICDAADVDEDCDGLADALDPGVQGTQTLYVDNDQDGHGAGAGALGCPGTKLSAFANDCDDTDGSWWDLKVFYLDADNDGHGDATKAQYACTAPVGYVALADDCDDTDVNANVVFSVYADNDSDTWGGSTTKIACRVTPGWVARGGDCDDTDGTLNPGTSWYVDVDGDGVGGTATVAGCPQPANTSKTTGDCNDNNAAIGATIPWYTDGDGDGYGAGSVKSGCPPVSGWATKGGDCKDSDSTVNPATTWYGDGDGDGYGVVTAVLVTCDPGAGYARVAGDCDNGDPLINPRATEVCNTEDDDCDTLIDDADPSVDTGTGKSFYPDGDGDKHGADNIAGVAACAAGPGMAGTADDCNDAAPLVYTGAPEQCNLIDDDCDGVVDDNVKSVDWYPDGDGDGYGSGTPTNTCSTPGAGFSLAKGDCNEVDPSINPGAVETCDGVDQDCDKQVDDAATDADTWYTDADDDGYGDPEQEVVSCKQPASAVADGTDCDDDLPAVHPDADEVCNDEDDDCNGQIDDDAADATEWYQDIDGDRFGDGAPQVACAAPDATWVDVDGDCDDGEALVYPGSAEQCNGADDDCDGKIDEDPVYQDWYADVDGDGYGDEGETINDCKQPDDFVLDATDCDDGDPAAHPGATEIDLNGVDEDCDGTDGGASTEGRPFDTDIEDTGLVPALGEACGCSAASTAGSGSLWGLGLILAVRRARRRRAA